MHEWEEFAVIREEELFFSSQVSTKMAATRSEEDGGKKERKLQMWCNIAILNI